MHDIWKRALENDGGPRYLALVMAIDRGIKSGALKCGDRLPTHRALATETGLALTTITRAYAEAERRGLVQGEVGRGTFVRQRVIAEPDEATIDLRPNSLLPYPFMGELADRMASMIQHQEHDALFGYQDHGGARRHRETGAAWLERAGVQSSPDQILVTAGAQHAMAAVFATLTQPGDAVLVEPVTYAGMKSLANLLGIRLRAVEMDGEGVTPDGVRRAALEEPRARGLYIMSALQNPTSSTMTQGRRQAIADVTSELGIPIIEDDSYAFLLGAQSPVSAFSSATYYLTGTSKSLFPSLRIGFLRAPSHMVERLEAAISSTVYLASPIMAEVVAQCSEDGTAEKVMQWKREELVHRNGATVEALGDYSIQTAPGSPHVWLELPEPWTARDFTAQAAMRGVHVTAADEFAVGRDAPHAVRLCLGPVRSRDQLAGAITVLVETLKSGPEPKTTIA